jgi:hypothetical protein
MARWLARLAGERIDVEEYPHWFPEGEMGIYAFWKDDRVFLAGEDFERAADSEEFIALAADALDRLTGIVSCIFPNIVRPTIDQYLREDDEGPATQILALSTIRSRSKVYAPSITQDGVEPSSETMAQQFLRIADRNPRLGLALTLWGEGMRTWSRLYRISEDLEAHLGQTLNKADFCSAKLASGFDEAQTQRS